MPVYQDCVGGSFATIQAEGESNTPEIPGHTQVCREFYRKNRRQQDHMANKHLGMYHEAPVEVRLAQCQIP